MRYFTKELLAASQPGSRSETQAMRTWSARSARYMKQVNRILPRLSRNAAEFFSEHSLHDGILVQVSAGDALLEPRIDPSMRRALYRNRRTSVSLTVLSNFSDPRLYTLTYTGLTAFEVRPDNSLFPSRGTVFGDWLYDELLPEGKEHFRHNILFETGTEISIVFRRFAFRRSRKAGHG